MKTIYRCDDGKEFVELSEAQAHEKKMNRFTQDYRYRFTQDYRYRTLRGFVMTDDMGDDFMFVQDDLPEHNLYVGRKGKDLDSTTFCVDGKIARQLLGHLTKLVGGTYVNPDENGGKT